ncbi:MAG TPA: hypothetical protein VM123_00890 [archaeon]|nr:hypothetical protein [archaeon]
MKVSTCISAQAIRGAYQVVRNSGIKSPLVTVCMNQGDFRKEVKKIRIEFIPFYLDNITIRFNFSPGAKLYFF